MKILFYSHFYPPEVGAAPTRIKCFVDVLRSEGHDVKVVAPKPNYTFGRILDDYKGKFIIQDSNENITYLPIFFVQSKSAFGRLLSYLSYFSISLIYLLFNSYRPDVVISSSPPIFTSLAALLYAKIKKSKFIFDVRDIWPDIGIQLGILNNKYLIKGLILIEKYLLKNAAIITVTAKGDKENIDNKIADHSKCKIIFNGADTSIFKPLNEMEKREIKKKYALPADKKIITYFGSYNHGMNDIDLLGDFLIHEEVAKENIHFTTFGTGANFESFRQKIDGKISYSVLDPMSSKAFADFVASCDLSIIPRKEIKEDTGGNIPVKCFESWAAGIPVLLSNIEDAEISKIFEECRSGVLVPPNDVSALVNGMKSIFSRDNKDFAQLGREYVVKNFDRKKEASKLSSLLL